MLLASEDGFADDDSRREQLMYQCGTCYGTWDYETPAGRCPYEYDHIVEEEPVVKKYTAHLSYADWELIYDALSDRLIDDCDAPDDEHVRILMSNIWSLIPDRDRRMGVA